MSPATAPNACGSHGGPMWRSSNTSAEYAHNHRTAKAETNSNRVLSGLRSRSIRIYLAALRVASRRASAAAGSPSIFRRSSFGPRFFGFRAGVLPCGTSSLSGRIAHEVPRPGVGAGRPLTRLRTARTKSGSPSGPVVTARKLLLERAQGTRPRHRSDGCTDRAAHDVFHWMAGMAKEIR
jgi:hypothetical protein